MAKICASAEPPVPANQAENDIKTQVDSATPPEGVMSWAEWKAAALNRLFLEQGTSGQPGRITTETVLHGERMKQVLEQRLIRRAKA